MSADNRSVSTDALETLGMVHFKSEARDAIHLAVEPVIAGEDLRPGEHIGIIGLWDRVSVASKTAIKKLGIVDPFVPGTIKKGERFWLVVYPRQISSLRHVWEHPDFPPANPVIPDIQAVINDLEIFSHSPDQLVPVKHERFKIWIRRLMGES